ncbi:MAG: hypothetical protein H7Y01_00860 [Ferruginibacter sp.]|nr:hypothetical protein [Chitinophagaceae bacterium]
MKKVLIFLMAISLFTACNNDKNAKVDRDKTSTDKDDYRKDDKKDMDDGKKDDTKDTKSDDEDTREDTEKSESWSRSDENKFMDDCEGTAKANVGAERANEYCDCMLQKIKKKYSSYVEADRKLAGSSQDEINKLASDCNGGQ